MFEFHLKQFLYFTYFTWFLNLQILHHVVVVVVAQSPMVPMPTYISHHRWEPSFAITVGAIIFILLLIGIISIYIRKCTQSRFIITQTNSNTTNRPCSCSQGINKELLETFPILFFSNIKDLKTGKGPLECAVCLTDFKDQDNLRLLPKCNHVFHPQCIDSWLASHVTCPVCRAYLNQDSCQVAINVPTLLSNDQDSEEGSRIRAETDANEENEIESNPNTNTNQNQNPVVHNEGEGNCDNGVASKRNLLRSNSTGHLPIEPVKCVDRYTLRLPDDVRRYILVNQEKRVQLPTSCNNNNNNNNNNNMVKGLCCSDSEGSSVEKRINGETMVERWVLCASPFVTRDG